MILIYQNDIKTLKYNLKLKKIKSELDHSTKNHLNICNSRSNPCTTHQIVFVHSTYLVEKTVRPNSNQPPNEKGNKSRILKKDHRKRMEFPKVKVEK